MITSVEIAKILRDQQRKSGKKSAGFDAALLGLGIATKNKKKK